MNQSPQGMYGVETFTTKQPTTGHLAWYSVFKDKQFASWRYTEDIVWHHCLLPDLLCHRPQPLPVVLPTRSTALASICQPIWRECWGPGENDSQKKLNRTMYQAMNSFWNIQLFSETPLTTCDRCPYKDVAGTKAGFDHPSLVCAALWGHALQKTDLWSASGS